MTEYKPDVRIVQMVVIQRVRDTRQASSRGSAFSVGHVGLLCRIYSRFVERTRLEIITVLVLVFRFKSHEATHSVDVNLA